MDGSLWSSGVPYLSLFIPVVCLDIWQFIRRGKGEMRNKMVRSYRLLQEKKNKNRKKMCIQKAHTHLYVCIHWETMTWFRFKIYCVKWSYLLFVAELLKSISNLVFLLFTHTCLKAFTSFPMLIVFFCVCLESISHMLFDLLFLSCMNFTYMVYEDQIC